MTRRGFSLVEAILAGVIFFLVLSVSWLYFRSAGLASIQLGRYAELMQAIQRLEWLGLPRR